MAHMTRPRLKAVETHADFTMLLTFVNGATFLVDFKPIIADSIGLAPLNDPAEFTRAMVIPGEGWAVEWEESDIQIGADTLWLDAQAQNAADEGTRVFTRWRSKYRLGLKQSAEALGLTIRTVSAYSNGRRPIPRTVQLACVGWEALHKAA